MDLQQTAEPKNSITDADLDVVTKTEETPKSKIIRQIKTLGFLKKKKGLRNTIIGVLIVAVVAGSYSGYQAIFGKSAEAKITTAVVERGDISNTISGSGTIAPIEQYDVTSLVKGEILSSPFEEGGTVNQGDLLYSIDTKDIENSIEKAKLQVETKQRDYQRTLDTVSDLSVTTPISGVVTNVYVKEGDSVSNNGKIVDMIDNSKMILRLPFLASDARNIRAGESAKVTLSGAFYTLNGKVTRVTSGTLVNDDGVEISNVEIVVDNPGAIKTTDSATAIIGNIACNGAGNFEYYAQQTVLAQTSGTVERLPYIAGDKVNKNAVVAYLSNDSTQDSIAQSRNSLKDAELALKNQYDQLENYSITSPISGTVLQKTSKAGDKIDNSNSNTVMAIIADMSTIVFDMSIDELDVGKITVGQKVQVTADAVENKTFTGHVDNISVVGTSSNGVTSYPVRIVVEDPQGLIPGMNVNAEIVVAQKQSVLKVPVSAVKRGNIVTVKITDENSGAEAGKASGTESMGKPNTSAAQGGAEGSTRPRRSGRPNGATSAGSTVPQTTASAAPAAQNGAGSANTGNSQGKANGNAAGNKRMNSNVPEGYKNVIVQVGINDETDIEIISGLNEGDIVVIPTVQSTTTNTNPMAGMGGMGGAPMGGGYGGGYGGGTQQRTTTGGGTTGGSSQRTNTGGSR